MYSFKTMQVRVALILLVAMLSACGKKSSSSVPAPTAATPDACSEIDIDEQTVLWPDGHVRKSNVYHCTVGGVSKDYVVDNGDSSQYFWR